MSLSLYWQRPPVEVERHGGVGHPTKAIVARALWGGDGSLIGDGVVVKGDPVYHYLRGVKDTAERDSDARRDLSALLGMIDQYGAAEVFTDG